MDYDIFFSYPHKDAEGVKQILQVLQAEGLNVWIDKSEISDYASITNSIVVGLARSKALLAYYSQNYWRSRACQWELTAGFLAAQREGDPRKRVLVINPDEKAEHIHPVELRDELFQKAPKDSEALKKLVQSVKNHVSVIKSAIGEIHALTQPQWYGRKGAGSNRFVGRLPDMWRIHSELHVSGVPIITGAAASAIVQLQGMGGVGKSLLAEEYALRYAAAFPGGVFWLRAFGNDDAKEGMGNEREGERIRQISDIAVGCGIPIKDRSPVEIETHLARELEGRGQPYLWVVDDVPSGMDIEILQMWLALSPQGKTLITTRTKEYNSLGKLIPLGVLEPREAYELLTLRRKPIGNLFIWDDVPGNDSGRLIDYLKQNYGIDLARTAKIEKIDDTIRVSDEKNHISLTLNHEESGAKTVHTLISRTVRFHETMPERIDQIKAAALSALIDRLSVINDGRIHSELKLEVAHARQLVNRGDDIKTAKLTGWVARYDYLHGAYKSAETLLRRESDIRNRLLGDEHPDTLTTMNNLAETLRAQGDLAGARKIQEQVLEITRRILGEEHPDTSLSAWNLVYTLLQMGNPAEAIDILKRDLLWLLQRESSDLEANQQKIREMIIQMIEQKDQSG